MRTFIAIDLDPPLRRPLLKLLGDLPRLRDVRWVTEHQLHVTLKFLGEVPDATIPKICAAAAEAARQVEPFPLRIAGLGCFPTPRNPRVLWAGVDDPGGGCGRWVRLADPLFEELNYKPETRAYTPHLTLGRSSSTTGANGMRSVLESTEFPATPEMIVREIVVFESRLSPRGAQYRVLAKIPLGAQDSAPARGGE